MVTGSSRLIIRLIISPLSDTRTALVISRILHSAASLADVRHPHLISSVEPPNLTRHTVFLRTLPNEYDSKSTYTWFPLFTPETMQKDLANLGSKIDYHEYTFDRPKPAAEIIPVGTHNLVSRILAAPSNYRARYAERARHILPHGNNGLVPAFISYYVMLTSVRTGSSLRTNRRVACANNIMYNML